MFQDKCKMTLHEMILERKDQVAKLREQYSIYVVGSGRINVAGITPANLDRLADAIAAVTAH